MSDLESMQEAVKESAMDLSCLPASRVENHRGFGLALIAFSFPFCALTVAGGVLAMEIGEPSFAGFAGLFLLVPLLVLIYGINCLMTKTIVHIDLQNVRVQEIAMLKKREWQEPLASYILQVKVLVSTASNNQNEVLRYTFHVRLTHQNDLRSVELFETESADRMRQQFQEYSQQLDIEVDSAIRDFNTNRVIGNLAAS